MKETSLEVCESYEHRNAIIDYRGLGSELICKGMALYLILHTHTHRLVLYWISGSLTHIL